VRSEEKMMVETLYKTIYARALDYERLAEDASKYQTIYMYHPQGRHTYAWNKLTQRMVVDQYTVDP
jgi:hypothetical protein